MNAKWRVRVAATLLLATIFAFTGTKLTFGHLDFEQHRDWYASTMVTEDRNVVLTAVTFSSDQTASLSFRRYIKTNEIRVELYSKYKVAEDTIQAAFVGSEAYTLGLMLPDMIEAFKDARSVTIHYFDVENNKRATKFSLMGFTRAYWWLVK